MDHSKHEKLFGGKGLVAELISVGLLDIDAYNSEGQKPLHIAVLNEKYLLVKSMLDNGVDVNTRSKFGNTALALAINESLPDMVKILLDHKADLHRVCKNGVSALRIAINEHFDESSQAKRLMILDLIFEYGLKSEDDLQREYYKLCKAIVYNDLRASKRLVDRLEDVGFMNIEAENPMAIAAALNRLKIVELLLHKGVSSSAQQVALYLAIDKKSLEMVKLLLKFKTNVNFLSVLPYKSLRLTPLHQATKNGDLEMMKILLHHGAKVEASLHYGDSCNSVVDTVLHLACEEGFSEGVELLIKNGAEVNAKNSKGLTPILSACDRYTIDNTKCVRILIEHGAEITEMDDSKQTILHYIGNNLKSSFVEFVLDLALDRGVDINARSTSGCTAVHRTICKNLVEFLKRGADLNVQSNNGSYPKHYWADFERGLDCPSANYLLRLQFLGYQIKNSDVQGLIIPDILSTWYQQELNQLKNWTIAWNPRITLHDVLFMTRNKLLRISMNGNLREAFAECSNDFESKYPYFGSVLNVQLRRGISRKSVTNSAECNLQKVFGQTISDVCSSMIFKYLSNDQLKQFSNEKFQPGF